MEKRQTCSRREFLKTTGGALSLLTMGAHLTSDLAGATGKARQRLKPTSPHIQRLLHQMEAKGDLFWSVPRKDGELLYFMVKATRSKNVLEVGTSHGFSAIWLGLALEETDGRLTTIEIDQERYDLARNHIKEAGLSQRITCIRGDAHKEVTRLQGPFDFVFLDADKEGQVDYFQKLYPHKLLPGGVLAVHNAIRQAHSMKDYLEMIQRHSDFDTVILSATLDDGFCLSYRHRIL